MSGTVDCKSHTATIHSLLKEFRLAYHRANADAIQELNADAWYQTIMHTAWWSV